jgi:DNA-binding transcriptional MerR regulator
VEKSLPLIPAKRYFTIGEVSELCGVKPYVLRYWEQEFTQLKPMKRRGNRRYYQHHEVLLVRRIRELLYEQGFTISGARNRLSEPSARGAPPRGTPRVAPSAGPMPAEPGLAPEVDDYEPAREADAAATTPDAAPTGPSAPVDVPTPGARAPLPATPMTPSLLRAELTSILVLLTD